MIYTYILQCAVFLSAIESASDIVRELIADCVELKRVSQWDTRGPESRFVYMRPAPIFFHYRFVYRHFFVATRGPLFLWLIHFRFTQTNFCQVTIVIKSLCRIKKRANRRAGLTMGPAAIVARFLWENTLITIDLIYADKWNLPGTKEASIFRVNRQPVPPKWGGMLGVKLIRKSSRVCKSGKASGGFSRWKNMYVKLNESLKVVRSKGVYESIMFRRVRKLTVQSECEVLCVLSFVRFILQLKNFSKTVKCFEFYLWINRKLGRNIDVYENNLLY